MENHDIKRARYFDHDYANGKSITESKEYYGANIFFPHKQGQSLAGSEYKRFSNNRLRDPVKDRQKIFSDAFSSIRTFYHLINDG